MNAQDLRLPTEFTLAQLEQLRALALREASVKESRELHNLGVKLTHYVDEARACAARTPCLAKPLRQALSA